MESEKKKSKPLSGDPEKTALVTKDHALPSAKPAAGAEKKAVPMTQKGFPPGWDDTRIKRVLAHYESQSEEETLAEDEAAAESSTDTLMAVPRPLVPAVRELIAKHEREASTKR